MARDTSSTYSTPRTLTQTRRPLLALTALLVLALSLLTLSHLLTGTASSQEGVHMEDVYLNSHELDPIMAALGATTFETAQALRELQAAAEHDTWSAVGDHPEIADFASGTIVVDDLSNDARAAVDDASLHVIAARLALAPAVDALYDDLSRTDEARMIAGQWQDCMARLGYEYRDPSELETDLNHPTSTHNGTHMVELIEARDACLDAVNLATERLLLRLLPDWKQENSAKLSAYRKALDDYADR